MPDCFKLNRMVFVNKIFMVFLITSVFLLSGCMVSQEKYDDVQSRLSQIESDKTELENEMSSLKSDLSAKENKILSLKSNLSKKESEIKSLRTEVSAKEDEVNRLDIESQIKSDYMELYGYLIAAANIQGSLDHQYWQIYNDPDGIYSDIYKDELNEYKAQIATTKDKINRLISKLESNSDVRMEGLPEKLDSVSELEDLRASMDLKVDNFEDELSDFE